MRIAVWTAAMCALLGSTSQVAAGVYVCWPADEWSIPPYSSNLNAFENARTIMRLASTSRLQGDQEKVQSRADVDEFRLRYLERIKSLEEKQRDGTLTVMDRVNLSGYYLRLFGPGNEQRAQQAIDVLTVGGRVPVDSTNFMLLSNLSTALLLRYPGDADALEIAYDYLKQAVDDWPVISAVFPEAYLHWCYRAEKLQLELLRVRRLEVEQRKESDSVDNLFPVLQKEWSKGYEAGRLAAKSLQQLPGDVVDLVGQLVLWMPHDERLHWLMAELVNAVYGAFVPAADMTKDFDETLARQKPAWYLKMHEHRRAWDTAQKWRQVLEYDRPAITEDALHFSQGIPVRDGVHWDVVPLTVLPLPEGAAGMLQVVALTVAVDKRNNTPGARREPLGGEPPPAPAETQQAGSSRWSGPDWKTMVVSFAAGVLVALLISQQWRQYQKKRQLPAGANEYLPRAGDKDTHIQAAP